MQVWIDAQLPPSLANALRSSFQVDARHVLELELATASDERIFAAARVANAIVITKDADFVRLLERDGPPPRILWLTVGNVRNDALRAILEAQWKLALSMFEAGERLVEIGRAG